MTIGSDEAAKLESLHVAVSGIAAATSVEEVFETVVDAADDVLAFDVCGVFLARDGRLEPVALSDPDAVAEPYAVDEGVIGETFQSGTPTLVRDAARNERATPADESFQSGVSVPLGEVGVLQAVSEERNYYDESDVELAELLAIHAAEAVTRIRSQRDLRAAKRKIERLHEVATTLESCTDCDELLSAAITAADDVLAFDWCLVARREAGAFVVEAVSPSTPLEVGEVMFPADADQGVTGHVVETGESMLIDDTRAHPIATPAHDSFRSGLVVPVGDDGVFAAVADECAAFDEQDLELAELFAANVGAAYSRIEARNALHERQAELDLLKDVYSRVLRHNLRNDLNVISGAVDRARRADPDEIAAFLTTIEETAADLAATSERARQIKRVVDRDDPLREVSLREAVGPVLDRLRSEHPQATITADVPATLSVTAHMELPLAVQCLVENGIHHNHRAEPTVSVTAHDRGDVTEIRVTDDGPGIPDHERRAIERSAETALEHCSGAGLWLARWVADHSSGRLRFDDPPAGTTVILELPTAS